jgi:hypothetical protein
MNHLEFKAPKTERGRSIVAAERRPLSVGNAPFLTWSATLLQREPVGAAVMMGMIVGGLFDSAFGFIAGGAGTLLLWRLLPLELE